MAEHRTFIPNNRPNANPETISRMQRDLSNSPHSEECMNSDASDMAVLRTAVGRIPHICVIGAGVAGLRCADVLLQHGVKVTILEGRDRVGGRLCQSDALGHMVDLGPNWIHGTDNNPMLDLAKETNTMTMDWDGRQAIFDRAGKRMPSKESSEDFELVWKIIEDAMKYSEENTESIHPNETLLSYFKKKVLEMIPSEMEGDEDVEKRRQGILDMAEMWGAFVGTGIEHQSLKFFWLEECIDGENLFVAATYKKILDRIAEPALRGAEIRFGHVVRKIVSNGTEDQPSVDIIFDSPIDGNTSQAFDEVVVTAPLGWLKRHPQAFEPELPMDLTRAIRNISYGHLDKVYITFGTDFWNTSSSDDTHPTTATYHTAGHPNVPATTAPVHQPTSPQPPVSPSSYPGFTHWTHPTSYSGRPWAQEAMNLAALPAPHAHPTLLFYTFGPTSAHLAEMLILLGHKESPVVPAQGSLAFANLSEWFKPYYSRLPNFDATNPAHHPEAFLATAWANDELAGHGSYCNFQVGLQHGDRDVECMRKGMPERGVWLAGEHAAPFVALGTVTGAWWSGEGVGKRVVKAWGLGRKEGSVDGDVQMKIANGFS